jgi:hypothetical protein
MPQGLALFMTGLRARFRPARRRPLPTTPRFEDMIESDSWIDLCWLPFGAGGTRVRLMPGGLAIKGGGL